MSKIYDKQHRRVLSIVMAFVLLLQLAAGLLPLTAFAAPTADSLTDQPGGKTKWVVVGSFQGWNNSSTDTQMKHLVGDFYEYSTVLPAGHYDFKLVKSGTWDGFSNEGNNFGFDLAPDSKVNFYVNEALNQARISLPGVQGIAQYVPALASNKWPRLVGDLQTIFGEPQWAPGQAQQFFVDYNFDNTVYKIQRTLPIGKYAAKVAFGADWTESYGANGSDLVVNVLDQADVTFTINYAADKNVSHDYVAQNSAFDGLIDKSAISFDSRSITYKKPFGAIKAGQEDLTLRISALQGDVQMAKVELTSPGGVSSNFTMHRVTSLNKRDYFEVTIPKTAFTSKGVWGYKFILVDGATKVEYGDDSARGGTGSVSSDGAIPYDLTVYDPNYQTPDWMKNAVVYQIFPDRFFDGDKSNNRAKTLDGYRGAVSDQYATSKGGQKLQYFDGGVPGDSSADQVWGNWSDVPENPDRTKPENKPYYPDAKSDAAWTNEFYGGDIEGIKQKLSYLKSTGINTIYLNPVSWAASNHKYDATDYMHLDPMFGKPVYNTPGDATSGLNYAATRAESDRVYEAFAKAARSLGMHIINDGVFNHVGDDSIYFDRYGKYPEIGAYEYWAKVYDKMNLEHVSQNAAETAVRAEFTSKINPLTGQNYKYPDDFRYISWFTVTNEKVKNHDDNGLHYKYDAWWGYDSLPAMDAKDPQTSATDFYPADSQSLPGQHEWNNIGYREAVIGHDVSALSDAQAGSAMQQTNSQRWLWMGSSGWRLDVAPDVSDGTWRKFREAVKSVQGRTDANGNAIENPVILGEEWGVATKYLLGDEFDSVMNYRFRGAVQSFMMSGDANALNQALESIREDYPKEAWQAMLNLVDSHDTTRSATKYDHPEWEEEHLKIAPDASDRALQLQALTAVMQMAYPGAPTVYYGDEVGLTGTKDPDSRRTFPWERIKDNGDGTFSGTGRYAALYGTYQKAAGLRNANDVFRTGDMKVAYANGDVIVYARKNATKGALVAVNRGSGDQTIQADVAGFLPEGLVLADRLGGTAQGTVTGGKVSLSIPAMSGMMMLSTTDLSPVPKVSNVKATGGNGTVSVSWDAVAGAEGYRVYRAAIEGGSLQLVGDETATAKNFADIGVVNGTKYYYTVTAKIGASESDPADMAAATPAFNITSVEILQSGPDMTIGVGNKTSEIQVKIAVPGLTDAVGNSNKEAPGMIGKLIYYPSTSSPDQAAETKLRYKMDDGAGAKIYWAQFEPIYSGSYKYEAQVSTDNGETFISSPIRTVQTMPNTADTTAPAAPVLGDIPVESNLAHLSWTLSTSDAAGIEVYRKEAAGEYWLIATLKQDAVDYVDYSVSNDTAYTYKVTAFDAAYNRADSVEKQVTPKLVMVDVKLRLHLPDYTPTTDSINIAGDFNGWNASSTALQVPSGATDRSVVEYSFKMMAGKSIQYKYTRGTWTTEAFTSHSRIANDTTDPGNWAYSSTDTNMHLTIANQGGNQMVVDDYVLRWVDMPMTISLPRTSYGSDITYSTSESTMDLKAVVPFGVAFTINGQPIPNSAMDPQGHVQLNTIPLNPGENTFVLHIEPTAETLSQPWYNDKGRASQATKTVTIHVTRTSGAVTDLLVSGPTTPLNIGQTWNTVVQAVYGDNSKTDVTAQADYQSDHPEIAKINTAGVVQAVYGGAASISVKYGGFTKSFTVNVTGSVYGGSTPPVTLTDLKVTGPNSKLEVGKTYQTIVEAVYSDKSVADVKEKAAYQSDDSEIASVDAGGVITAHKTGKAVITVQFGGMSRSITVEVSEKTPPTLKDLKITQPTGALNIDQRWNLIVKAVYSDTSETDVTASAAFESDHLGVVSMKDSIIQALGAGDAVITVRFGGLTKTFTVHVNQPATNPGPSGPVDSVVNPADKGTQTVTPDQLKADNNGNVTVTLAKDTNTLVLPLQAGSAAGAKTIEITGDSVTVKIPADVLKAVADLLPPELRDGAKITFNVKKLDDSTRETVKQAMLVLAQTRINFAGDVYDFSLQAVTKDGKSVKLSTFDKPIQLTFRVDASANPQLTGVYYISDSGQLEYVGGKWKDGQLTAEVTHFSRYAALQYDKSYLDVSAGHWAQNAIAVLSAKHVVDGVTDTSFAPNDSVSRAQFAAMVVRAFGLKAKAKASFSDVKDNDWFAAAVAAAYENGIVDGVVENVFAPEQRITREEMAVMIVRAYQSQKGSTSAGSTENKEFADASSISFWADASVKTAAALGLLQGRDGNRFAPKNDATRAESAQVIYNLISKF